MQPILCTNYFVDDYGFKWHYNCGWNIIGHHPYRVNLDGEDFLLPTIGILAFYQEYKVLPFSGHHLYTTDYKHGPTLS